MRVRDNVLSPRFKGFDCFLICGSFPLCLPFLTSVFRTAYPFCLESVSFP